MPQTHLSYTHASGQRINQLKRKKIATTNSLCKGEKKNQTSSSIPTKLVDNTRS